MPESTSEILIALKRQRREDYELYRNRMQHEDDLVGHRIGWLVSSQAFLLTPYVLLYLKPLDIKQPDYHSSSFLVAATAMEYLIVLIALISCAISLRSTTAAIHSMCILTIDYLQRYEPDPSFEPGIGLARDEGIRGLSAARGLPLAFAVAWLWLLFLSLGTYTIFDVSSSQVDGNQMKNYWLWLAVTLISILIGVRIAIYVFVGFARERQRTAYFNHRIKNLRTSVPTFTIEITANGTYLIKVKSLTQDSKDWLAGYNLVQKRDGKESVEFKVKDECFLTDLKVNDSLRVVYRGLLESDTGNSSHEKTIMSIDPLTTNFNDVEARYTQVAEVAIKPSEWLTKICFNLPLKYSPDDELIKEPIRTV